MFVRMPLLFVPLIGMALAAAGAGFAGMSSPSCASLLLLAYCLLNYIVLWLLFA